jgi:diguanylate cyclase (GGDEF)-like protein/PAS domain S-box-containing protein
MPAFQDPETYRDILDGLQIGVSVLDLEKKIVFWSDGAEQVTGYARIDVLGHSCRENIFLHCNEISCEMCGEKCSLAKALRDTKPVETMGLIHHKSGHRTSVRTWAIPLRNKQRSIIGIIQTFEGEFAAADQDPNDRSMKDRSIKEHGCLDDTTGLPNQALMQSHLREMLGTFAELEIPFAIVFVHAHGLNLFRARYGQEAGKSIIQVLARTLRNTVWPTDFVGRWSDDQFLVILSGCGDAALEATSERMLKMMASASIHWWGDELSVAVSIGRTGAVTGDSVESILERARRALSGNQTGDPVRAAAAVGANPLG